MRRRHQTGLLHDARHRCVGAQPRGAARPVGDGDEAWPQRLQPADAGPELLLQRLGLRWEEFERQQRRRMGGPPRRQRGKPRTGQPALQGRPRPVVRRSIWDIVHGASSPGWPAKASINCIPCRVPHCAASRPTPRIDCANLNRPLLSGATGLPCSACQPGLGSEPTSGDLSEEHDARRHPLSPPGDHRRAAGQRLAAAPLRRRRTIPTLSRTSRRPMTRSSRPTG